MRQKILNYVIDWENKCYKNGIPDEAPLRLDQLNKVPSYKSIVRAIIKNDFQLKTLGFNPEKSLTYNEIKRQELEVRNPPKQLKLF